MGPNVSNQLIQKLKEILLEIICCDIFAVKLNIPNRVAVISMSLISISNGIVVPPLGSVKLIVARKDRFCSGTISGVLNVTVAPEKE